jgi:hypothetical protein
MKRKLTESQEQEGQTEPKRTTIDALQTKREQLLERLEEIKTTKAKELEPYVKTLEEQKVKIEEQKVKLEKEYATEVSKIATDMTVLLDQISEHEYLELAWEIIQLVQKDPERPVLFNDQELRSDKNAQQARELLNKELGGYLPCTGYFGLRATGSQIACNWNYSDLEWESDDSDYWYNDADHLVQLNQGSGEPTFYIDEVEGIDEVKINTSLCEEVEWDETAPKEDDITWETDKSSVDVYGKAFKDLVLFTKCHDADKTMYKN